MDYTAGQALVALAIRHKGDWHAIYEAVRKRDTVPYEVAMEYFRNLPCKYVSIADEDYPESIRQHCPQAPFALFYQGDIRLLQDPRRLLTVVGSRAPGTYAYDKTKELCEGVAENGYIVVSGLARGIDTAAAEATARRNGRAVAFLGNGPDYYYPSENKELQKLIAQNGLVVSEYPPGVTPQSRYFPARNRLMAAVSQATFLGEGKPNSGSLITVAFALEFNRDVGALPFPAGEEVCNNFLLKRGCALIETVDDLLLMLDNRIIP
ncbi:MAG: DNA-protecting protein DprA [Bacilli bacterium]|nr:DNA-protecting protein DprA [Bacilli bacterium]